MSRDVPFDEKATCDYCGKLGVYDFMGDLLCPECAEKIIAQEPDTGTSDAGGEA